jgi:hypothetical protein
LLIGLPFAFIRTHVWLRLAGQKQKLKTIKNTEKITSSSAMRGVGQTAG